MSAQSRSTSREEAASSIGFFREEHFSVSPQVGDDYTLLNNIGKHYDTASTVDEGRGF